MCFGVLGYGFVGSRSRGAGGLATCRFLRDPLCEQEYETCVDRKRAAPARWGVSLLAWGSQGEWSVCVRAACDGIRGVRAASWRSWAIH